jgi:hypothetical protein
MEYRVFVRREGSGVPGSNFLVQARRSFGVSGSGDVSKQNLGSAAAICKIISHSSSGKRKSASAVSTVDEEDLPTGLSISGRGSVFSIVLKTCVSATFKPVKDRFHRTDLSIHHHEFDPGRSSSLILLRFIDNLYRVKSV